MEEPTSSSKTGPAETGVEWKVVVTLVAVLLLLEGAARLFEGHLSRDVAHLRALSDEAESLSDPNGFKVLVIGNSLARRGLDRERLGDGLNQGEEGGTALAYMVPDASNATEWSWGLRRYFNHREVGTDLNLVFTGERHLLGGNPSPERLGGYFVGREDWGRFIAESETIDSSVRFLLGANSALFANRERVRPLVGFHFLPGFEKVWGLLAGGGMKEETESGEDSAAAGPAQGIELENLRRLCASLEATGGKSVVVMVPMPEPYRLGPEIVAELESAGIEILDFSRVTGITEEDFPDGYHLGERGAEKFTELLVKELDARLEKGSG